MGNDTSNPCAAKRFFPLLSKHKITEDDFWRKGRQIRFQDRAFYDFTKECKPGSDFDGWCDGTILEPLENDQVRIQHWTPEGYFEPKEIERNIEIVNEYDLFGSNAKYMSRLWFRVWVQQGSGEFLPACARLILDDTQNVIGVRVKYYKKIGETNRVELFKLEELDTNNFRWGKSFQPKPPKRNDAYALHIKENAAAKAPTKPQPSSRGASQRPRRQRGCARHRHRREGETAGGSLDHDEALDELSAMLKISTKLAMYVEEHKKFYIATVQDPQPGQAPHHVNLVYNVPGETFAKQCTKKIDSRHLRVYRGEPAEPDDYDVEGSVNYHDWASLFVEYQRQGCPDDFNFYPNARNARNGEIRRRLSEPQPAACF